jgi:hypothetical protein
MLGIDDDYLGVQSVPRIYEIWSRRAPTFIWPIRPVCQCRSLNELLVRKLSYGQVTCAHPYVNCPSDCKVGAVSTKFRPCGGPPVSGLASTSVSYGRVMMISSISTLCLLKSRKPQQDLVSDVKRPKFSPHNMKCEALHGGADARAAADRRERLRGQCSAQRGDLGLPGGMGLHSSTFQLDVSIFWATRRAVAGL